MHKMVDLAAVLGLGERSVQGLCVCCEHGGGLVIHWAMSQRQTVAVVGDGGGDREDGGEDLPKIAN